MVLNQMKYKKSSFYARIIDEPVLYIHYLILKRLKSFSPPPFPSPHSLLFPLSTYLLRQHYARPAGCTGRAPREAVSPCHLHQGELGQASTISRMGVPCCLIMSTALSPLHVLQVFVYSACMILFCLIFFVLQ